MSLRATLLSVLLLSCGPADTVPTESVPADSGETLFVDSDGDGYGDAVAGPGEDGVAQDGDCNDADGTVFPGAEEICDGQQNDCAGEWSSDEHVTLTEPDGTATDLFDVFAGGSEDAPAVWALDTDGMLSVCGEYTVNLTISAADATITGSQEHSILQGGGGQILVVSAGAGLHLEGLTLTGGRASFGGALNAYEATVSLSGVTISNNTGGTGGGGVTLVSSTAELVDTTFLNNTTSGNGGGLWLNNSEVVIEASVLNDNTAGDLGGAIILYDTENRLTVTDTDFIGNSPADVCIYEFSSGNYTSSSDEHDFEWGSSASFVCEGTTCE